MKEFRARISKSEIGYPQFWYDRLVARKLSAYITFLLVRTSISANGATFLQIACGLMGGIFLSFFSIGWCIFGAVLLQISYILDCVDGELARYRKKSSVEGIFIDFTGHIIVIFFMFLGLGAHFFKVYNSGLFIIVGAVCGLLALSPVVLARYVTLNFLLTKPENPSYNYEKLHKNIPQPHSPRPFLEKVIKGLFEFSMMIHIITLSVLTEFFFNSGAGAAILIVYMGIGIVKETGLFIRYIKRGGMEKYCLSKILRKNNKRCRR